MKKINKRTWISVLCVFCAIVASSVYNAMREGEKPEEELALVSEITPTATPIPLKIPAPLATPQHTPQKTPEQTPKESPEAKAVSAPKAFLLPSSGEVALPFSDKTLSYFPSLGEWRCHLGVDFTPSDSDKVLAVANGKVEKIYEDHLFGSTVCIDHGDGLKSFYASLAASTVSEGQDVAAGTEIGRMGETACAEAGVHLHFSMEKDGNPIDPFGNKE